MERASANPLFPALDGVRALAVTLVFISHAVVGRFLTEYANLGVTLFFVLSGFLLYRPFVAARESGTTPSLKRYFRRRVLRILPAYWVALTIILVGTSFPDDAWRLYLLVQAYSPHTVFDGIAGAWSLCVEAAFYLVLPLYAALAARTPPSLCTEIALLGVMTASSVVFRAVVGPTSVLAYASLPGTFAWFAAGMALARVTVARPTLIHSLDPRMLWAVATAIYFLLPTFWPPSGQPFDPVRLPPSSLAKDLAVYLASAVFGLCIVTAAVRSSRNRILRSPPVVALGVISYGIFLWHIHAIWFAEHHAAASARGIVLVQAALLSVFLAALSYVALEKWGTRRRYGVVART